MIIGSIDTIQLDPAEFLGDSKGIIGLRLIRNTDDFGAPTEDQYRNHWFIVQDLTQDTAQLEREHPPAKKRPILGNAKNIRAPHDAPWITLRLNYAQIVKAWLEKKASKIDGRPMAFLSLTIVPTSEKQKQDDPLTDYIVSQDPGQERRIEGVKAPRLGIGTKGEKRERPATPTPRPGPRPADPHDGDPATPSLYEDDIPF